MRRTTLPRAVRVTAKHIKAGKRRRVLKCPLALALYEKTGKHWAVMGTVADWRDRRIRILGGGTFADRFDMGKVVKPTTFKLEEVDAP